MRYALLAVLAFGLAAMPAIADPQVSEADIDTFATIYMGMEATRGEIAQEMSQADTPEAAQAVRETANERMVAVIEEHGWTLERYNEVAGAINEDPELRSMVLDRLQERS